MNLSAQPQVSRGLGSSATLPLFARMALVDPLAVERGLERLRTRGLVDTVPNAWQITLGVVRMWHRIVFRSETIGTSAMPIRSTWRARLLAFRPARFPFLVAERAIAPLDTSGLVSSRERVIRHLLGAHHDAKQFVYDLEILEGFEGALDELVERTREVVERDTPRSRWLRDLVVHEGYHEALLRAAERAREGELGLDEAEASDPDISFRAYLDWCAHQPSTPEETLRALLEGRYSFARGLDGELAQQRKRSAPRRERSSESRVIEGSQAC
jgi:hypothetical protein